MELVCKLIDLSFHNEVTISDLIPFVDTKFFKYAQMNYRPQYHDFFTVIESGHFSLVRFLLQDGRLDPSIENSAALLIASRRGYTKIVELLLQDGRANPASQNNGALFTAAHNNRYQVVELLLKDGRSDPRILSDLPLRRAVEEGHPKIVELLLQDGRSDPTSNENCAFIDAIKRGNVEIVKLFLEDGRIQPGLFYNRALRLAVKEGHYSIVELLLNDPRTNSMDTQLLIIAVENNRQRTFKLLLDRKIDPTSYLRYYLLTASVHGYSKIVEHLLDCVELNPSDVSEALKTAKTYGHMTIVELLQKV